MLKVDSPPHLEKLRQLLRKNLRKGTGVTKCIHSGELASLRFI